MINSKDKLFVFENFQADRDLPKFSKKKQAQAQYSVSSEDFEFEDSGESKSMNMTVHPGSLTLGNNLNFRPHWIVRAFWWILAVLKLSPYVRWWPSETRVKQQAGKMSIEEFFSSVRNSTVELKLVKDRAAGYERAMIRAKQGGQQALFEQLVSGLNAYKMESQLMAMGLFRYLNEADLVSFYKQSKRGLRLDWVRNFTRQIPQDVLDKKIRADEIGIFDNYAVLHYDPQTKSWAETQEEKNRRKDPILFGLIEGRRRLYCVGDWKDEMCDLTLDEIADALGKEAVKDLANETVDEVMGS